MTLSILDGIRVLDLSQYLPGPFAARMLGDFGADVIKVEPPGGEPGRRLDRDGQESVSPYYHIVNAGKRVVEVDLKDPMGRATLERLIQASDVLLESYRPGVLARLGFGEAHLRSLNRRLIHCALSGYGQTGPNRLVAGHDLNYVALTGALSATGTEDAPVIPFPPMADHAGALQSVVAILAALVARERLLNGTGCSLDIGMSDALLALQELAFAFDTRRRRGLLTGGSAGYQIYRTKDDRFVTISPLEPKFWANFCEAVGRPDWIARQDEPLPQHALIGEVAELFASEPLSTWVARLGDIDCCFQAVLDHDEVPDNAHVQARGLIRRHPDWTEVLLPVRIDGAAPPPRADVAFADADAVLAGWSLLSE